MSVRLEEKCGNMEILVFHDGYECESRRKTPKIVKNDRNFEN